jgi:hypothetical protein
MLKTALQARLPLITCTTSDTLHATEVVRHLSGVGKITMVDEPGISKIEVAFVRLPRVRSWHEVITKNVASDRTLIIINPDEPIPEAFNAGEMPVPEHLIRKKLTGDYMVAPAHVMRLMGVLGGLTLKEIDEVARLAQAEAGQLSVESVRSVRRYTAQVVPGVRVIGTSISHYWNNPALEDFYKTAGGFLLKQDIDYRLRPRGLLCTGLPGTGKTLGSKWLAQALGVPLLRLDVGSVMSKYVGESEANLIRALTTVENTAPCVMLVDEIEKLFHGNDDSGVTQNLLAGLLWWLQEHTAQVLTVMTSNDETRLPPELIRPGRVDCRINFEPLKGEAITDYADGLLESMGLEKNTVHVINTQTPRSHASVTAEIIEQVRKHLLTNEHQ